MQTQFHHENFECLMCAPYRGKLEQNLSKIEVPLTAIHCTNTTCKEHTSDIQNFHDEIVSACISASKSTIPYSSDKSKKVIPGWSDYVEGYRKDAVFWHFIWKCNNSPRSGYLADIRNNTRSKYHYALRYVKRNKEMCSANKLAESIINSKTRDFWFEVRKIRNAGGNRPSNIDGVSEPSEIGELFANKYAKLYNSVPYDVKEMDMLKTDLEEAILSGESCQESVISVDKMKSGIIKLKKGEHDGDLGYYADHIINGNNSLHVYLSLLFSTMMLHGTAPAGLTKIMLHPIPKDKRKSLSDSDNYRGIALSHIFGKLLDCIIMAENMEL